MKYFLDLLENLKKGDILPAYLFYGPESYLREQAVARFREKIFPSPYLEDFNYTVLDGEETSPRELVNIATTAPFPEGRRLLLVKNPPYFKGKGTPAVDGEALEPEAEREPPGDQGELLKYLTSPTEYTCIIFNTSQPVDRRKKIFKQLEKKGRAIEFSYLNSRDLTRWLDKQAAARGKKIAPDAAEELLYRAGSGLQNLHSEINKLLSYVGDEKIITRGDVLVLTPPPEEEDIFAVVDAIGQRQPRRAIDGIKKMLVLKKPPQVILTMVARQFRLLIMAREAMERGGPPADAAKKMGVHPFVAKKALSQCRNFSMPVLVGALHRLYLVDSDVKSGRRPFLPAIELFIAEVSNPKIQ